MTLRLLPCGDAAVMLDLDSLDEVLRLQPVLDATRPLGVVDIVPGARSILVTVDPHVLPLAAARSWALAARPSDEAGTRGGAPVGIDVVYDGEDLADVAALLGIGVREVVERHTSGTWTVAFGGFAPGFGYLAGVRGDVDAHEHHARGIGGDERVHGAEPAAGSALHGDVRGAPGLVRAPRARLPVGVGPAERALQRLEVGERGVLEHLQAEGAVLAPVLGAEAVDHGVHRGQTSCPLTWRSPAGNASAGAVTGSIIQPWSWCTTPAAPSRVKPL